MRAFHFRSISGLKVAAEIHISQQRPHEATVEHLWVHPRARGRGFATSMMIQVCMEADSERVRLYLQPSPFSHHVLETDEVHQPSLTPPELRAFYKKFGFKMKPRPWENLMVRGPRRI